MKVIEQKILHNTMDKYPYGKKSKEDFINDVTNMSAIELVPLMLFKSYEMYVT